MLTCTQGWFTGCASFQALQGPITNNKDQRNTKTWLAIRQASKKKLLFLGRCDAERTTRLSCWLIILWAFFAFVIPPHLFGEGPDKESKIVPQGSLQEDRNSKSNFALNIKDNLISLDAKDASLVEIVEELGSRIKIDVITKIPEEEKITIKVEKLPLEAAIERLREFADIAYIRDSEKEDAKITKILVFPKGKAEMPFKSGASAAEESVEALEVDGEEEEAGEEETQRPEPFKFEFDPSEYLEE